jgi:hypothetical protein
LVQAESSQQTVFGLVQQLILLAHKGQLVLKAQLVLPDLLDLQDLKAHKVLQAQLDLKVLKAHKDLLVLLVLQVLKV